MSKAKLLRDKFKNNALVCIAGAHDGLSAKLVEKADFDGIWASGFEISASYGVPDANILTMSQYLERACEMNDVVEVPVIADCDTGYGNSNNVIYMVKKYENAGIAAVCIEDKKFPKTNSLLSDGRQELASVAEFVGKIMAAKNAQQSDDFMVIARVEAFIAGCGQTEAILRANAYADAGADAILIHSKSSSPNEIINFMKEWRRNVPIVVVPTTYSAITAKELANIGIKMAIYANQGIRSAVRATSEILSKIKELGTSYPIEGQIASMKEIFELQNMTKMKDDEEKYLKTDKEKVIAIIPTAGDHLKEYSMKAVSSDIPIAMLDINGKPLLQRQVETLKKSGVEDIYIVVGYKHELINVDGVNVICNDNYNETGILHSIMCAQDCFEGRLLVIYGDILFDELLINRFLKCSEDITILADDVFNSKKYGPEKEQALVKVEQLPIRTKRKLYSGLGNRVLKIGAGVLPEEAHYWFPGLMCISSDSLKLFKDMYATSKKRYSGKPFYTAETFEKVSLTNFLQEIVISGHPIHCLEAESGWLEIHSMDDYKLACSMTR